MYAESMCFVLCVFFVMFFYDVRRFLNLEVLFGLTFWGLWADLGAYGITFEGLGLTLEAHGVTLSTSLALLGVILGSSW